MAKNSHSKFFRDLAQTGELDAAFMKLIKNSPIYRQIPAANLRQFTKAFRSPKTAKSVRYAMIVAALTYDPSFITRAMRIDVKDATYAIEPVYKPRLGLSHFKITGIGKDKRVFDPKLNPRARRILMGSPISTSRAALVKSVMDLRVDAKAQRKLLEAALAKGRTQRTPRGKGDFLKLLGKSNFSQLIKPHKLIDPKSKLGQQIQEVKNEVKLKSKLEEDLKNAFGEIFSDFEQYPDPLKVAALVNNYVNEEWAKVNWTELVKDGFSPEYLVMTIELSTELSKYLEGLIWVLHSFIKLNDHRNIVFDSDPPTNADPAYMQDERKLDLHGFPEHLAHYADALQSWKYAAFWIALGLAAESVQVIGYTKQLQGNAETAEEGVYEDEEIAQDEVDKLIHESAALLTRANDLLSKVINPAARIKKDPFFSLQHLVKQKIVLEAYEPGTLPFTPHYSEKDPNIKQRFLSKDREEIQGKIQGIKTTLKKWTLANESKKKKHYLIYPGDEKSYEEYFKQLKEKEKEDDE